MNFLTLFISLRCTQACAHCLYGCSPVTGEHMSIDVFNRSLVVARENNIPALNFFGGEPLLNPEIIPMLQKTLDSKLSVILATNCRPFSDKRLLNRFLDITKDRRGKVVIVTARDKFHLEFFDPAEIIDKLKKERFEIVVNDYSNQSVLLSEYNQNNPELKKLDTDFTCCVGSWADSLGVLPDGGWAICPVSLEPFGNIFKNGIEEITGFKKGLPFNLKNGCTECLKDFAGFRKQFEELKSPVVRR